MADGCIVVYVDLKTNKSYQVYCKVKEGDTKDSILRRFKSERDSDLLPIDIMFLEWPI